MNDEHNINLPPDADNLSKHAPALFKLKGTETARPDDDPFGRGFVVPALYFEELSELVVSKTAIPEDGGLTVPLNYFEESEDVIVSLVSIPSEDGLIVPENYFGELPAIVESESTLSDFDSAQSDKSPEEDFAVPENYFESLKEKIESQISLGNYLSKAEAEVPAGYFDEMQSELQAHIALDNLKQDEGFVLPEKYFGNLTEKVLAETSLNKDEVDNDQVPVGYFEALHGKIVARIENESGEEKGRVIVLAQWKKYAAITTIAASVALLIVFVWTLNGNDDRGTGSLNYAHNSSKGIVPGNIAKETPAPAIDTNRNRENIVAVPENIAYELPKKSQQVKLKKENEVKLNVDEVELNVDEIIAQSDLMDEALVMDFVSENSVIEETEEALDPAMIEYLMNDNAGLDVFIPGE